jgi:hypothetical protein
MKKILFILFAITMLSIYSYSEVKHPGAAALGIRADGTLQNVNVDNLGNVIVSSTTGGTSGGVTVYQNYSLQYSSYTASADTLKEISGATALIRVMVSSGTSGGSLILYNSKSSATGKIATIDLGTVNTYEYGVGISSGLTYTSAGNTYGLTIIYKK